MAKAQTIDGERRLQTVVAERPGSTAEPPILIVAHRDAAKAGAEGEMSATAALLELARVFAARETKRTIVLVSTSGGSGGDAGAAEPARGLEAAGIRGPFDAAIVLGDLAAASLASRSSFRTQTALAPRRWSSRGRSRPRSTESGWDPGAPSTFGQLAHLAFPLAAGEQGVLGAGGSARRARAGERRTRTGAGTSAVGADASKVWAAAC